MPGRNGFPFPLPKGSLVSQEFPTKPLTPVRFLRLPEVLARVPVSKVHIYRMENEGRFPRRRKISKHAVAWVEAEVDDWCAKHVAGEKWEGSR